MLLIKYSGNWADEMDVNGFTIMTEKHWEYKKLEAKHCDYPVEIGCGTNEYVEYDNVEDFLKSFKVQEISEEEIKTIKKFILDGYDYGFFALLEGNAPNSFYEKYGYCPD